MLEIFLLILGALGGIALLAAVIFFLMKVILYAVAGIGLIITCIFKNF